MSSYGVVMLSDSNLNKHYHARDKRAFLEGPKCLDEMVQSVSKLFRIHPFGKNQVSPRRNRDNNLLILFSYIDTFVTICQKQKSENLEVTYKRA